MPEIPYGFCHCGCGQKTNVPTETKRKLGMAEGRPMRFRQGHHARLKKADIRIEDRGYKTACWISQQRNGPRQYCRLRDANGVQRQAHRLYYERFVGPIPDGLQIDHLCCNKLCVNPAHLEPVTAAENTRRGCAKLNEEAVREIRLRLERPEDLAKRFGVAASTIRAVQARRAWRDVA